MILFLLFIFSLVFVDSIEQEEKASPTQARKSLYHDTVVASYGSPTVIPCPCEPNFEIAGSQISSVLEINTSSWQMPGSRDPSLPIWPFMGQPLPDGRVQDALCRVQCDKFTTGDMDLTQLVRVLCLAKQNNDTALQEEIIAGLQALYDSDRLRFWLQPDETFRCYWSENHQILWLSSTYLLKPLLSLQPSDEAFRNVEARLQHFFTIKLKYGFYEFFSTTYQPYTLAALLNLVDFAPHGSEIQIQAQQVATRLLKEWLLVVNDQGSFYPVAGRNFEHRYMNPPFLGMVWLLTGKGPPLTEESWRDDYVTAFLSTSHFDLEPIASEWTSTLDTQLYFGHPIEEHIFVHGSLSTIDRTMYQWSAGGYTHPNVVADTKDLMDRPYGLKNHKLFQGLRIIFSMPKVKVRALSIAIPGNSRGTNIAEAHVSIYKNQGVVLTSLQDFNVGYRSGEQWVWMATVGDIAVWTQSGITGDRFKADIGNVANIHMPDIKQEKNVALISYRPAKDVVKVSKFLTRRILDIADYHTQVALRFPVERFDQVEEVDRWILGRKGDSYIGVWRHGLQRHACPSPAEEETEEVVCEEYYFSNPLLGMRAQAWAVVVGNAVMYGTFSNFTSIVGHGIVTERKRINLLATKFRSYHTSLSVDGIELDATLK